MFREEWRFAAVARAAARSPSSARGRNPRPGVAGRAAHPALSPKMKPRDRARTLEASIDEGARHVSRRYWPRALRLLSLVGGELIGKKGCQHVGAVGDEVVVEVFALRRQLDGFDRVGGET